MKRSRILFVVSIVMAILSLCGGVVWAAPGSQAFFSETDLGGGQWKYDFNVYNTSDPVIDAKYDLYDFYLSFSPGVSLTSIDSPSNWDFFSDSHSFIDWLSTIPGEPATGSDIPPGASLSSFSLTSNTKLSLPHFETLIVNPNNPSSPVFFSGNATPASVPEPHAVLLICSGLIGLVGFKKEFRTLNL